MIPINKDNFPRIFIGFTAIWQEHQPEFKMPKEFAFDETQFNLPGIEAKLGFLTNENIQAFAISPELLSQETLEDADLQDAHELFDEFFMQECS